MKRREDLAHSIFGYFSEKKKKSSIDQVVTQINVEYKRYKLFLGINPREGKTRDFFKSRTESLRGELKTYIKLGYSEEEALKRILPKAYGLVKLASEVQLKKPHYDVQLMGGILLNDGYVSEMATGEGKTITAALPTFLNALTGKGAHVITPNEYLAKRDYEEMKPLYELLGLSVGLVEEIKPTDRSASISKRTDELYQTDLAKYDRKGKTEEIIDKELFILRNQARREAIKQISAEDISYRQRQYQSDITYGSSNAFAFDYLFDGLETDPNNIRNRMGNPNFLVIDEADAVLFDDAVTPFVLSGTQEDEELAISEAEKQKKLESIRLSALFMDSVQRENDFIIKYIRDEVYKRTGKMQPVSSTSGLILRVNDPIKFEKISLGDVKETHELDMTQAIYYCPKTKEFHITTLGETMVFSTFKNEEVSNILNRNKDLILNLTYNGNPLFREKADYEIDSNGNFILRPRALAYLIESGSVPELTSKFDEFMTREYQDYWEDINNAIYANLLLERDVEYKYSIPSGSKDPEHERSISLIMNGRTAEGRVYSKGLQQAIEEKERIMLGRTGSDIKIVGTKLKDTLASIPAASFFGRYEKFSGMTGTSAISAFRELYGLDTFVVPRNKPRNVTDKGDRLYSTRDQKNRAILEEVSESYRKGQPVLLATTSVDESISLRNYLVSELRKMNINIDIPVLNANVDNLEEEARIIADAGAPRAITISTEMAGRGTDIRLGGKEPSLEEEIELERQRRIERVIANMQRNNPSLLVTDSIIRVATDIVDKHLSDVTLAASATVEKKKNIRKINEQRILSVGGLKVVGSGHFSYSRVDDQVKGRCGRQGNRGEIVFFNDIEDLRRVGVSPKDIQSLEKQLRRGPIIEDPTTGRTPVGDIIYMAQAKVEEQTKEAIFQNQKIEKEVAQCRSDLRTIRVGIKQVDNYIADFKNIVEITTRGIIVTSSNLQFDGDLRRNIKLSRIKLDREEIKDLTEEFLGVKITDRQIHECKTTGDLIELITTTANNKFEGMVQREGKKNVEIRTKKIVDSFLNRTWFDFENYLETIKRQYGLAKMIPGTNPPEDIDACIIDAYMYCKECSFATIAREILNPNYIKKKEHQHEGLTDLIIETDATTRRVRHDEGKRINTEREEAIEHEVENAERMQKENRQRKLTSINVPYFIRVLNEKLKINRDSDRIRRSRGTKSEDEIESVDFGNSPKK